MKTTITLSTVALLSAMAFAWAESKRTAEFILSDPSAYEGKEVTLDVALVKPVHWKSPLPEFAFFHALTIDRGDHRPGGGILVAIPAANSAAFAKKYGLDFDGRNDMDTLRGSFIAVGRPGRHSMKVWIVDTTGELVKKIEELKAELPEEAFSAGMVDWPGMGGPGGAGPRGPRRY